jgi:ABC-type nitrate/sulfonate/bicarbonate transport system permease component
LRDKTVASVLFVLFGLAVACTLAAIGAFTLEMLMAGTGIRARVAESQKNAGRD